MKDHPGKKAVKRFLMVLLILGLMVGSVASAGAGEEEPAQDARTVEGTYGPYPAPVTGCNSVLGSYACLIINTTPYEAFFAAKVTDVHGLPVFVEVRSGGGLVAIFCGETTDPVAFNPGSSLNFHVGLNSWLVSPDCPANRVKTSGTISVTLYDRVADPAPKPEPNPSPVPRPSPTAEPTTEERSVDLVLRRHLRSEGAVTSDHASCRSQVSVVIERKTSSDWIEVGSTTTDSDGTFVLKLSDRSGRYRAILPEIKWPERTCMSAVSEIARHRH